MRPKCIQFLLIFLSLNDSKQVPKHRLKQLNHRIDESNNENDLNIDKNIEPKSRPLTDKDFENGRRLSYEQLHGFNGGTNGSNDFINKDLFEGDIIIKNRSQLITMYSRSAVRGNYLKWRNAKIPYVLSNEYTDENRSLIARVFEEFHNKTCIRFVPKRWFHFNYLTITPGVGCASQVGRVGGKQAVSLGESCMTLGIVEHELMHAMGFWHEQSRADRDEWVRINWDNVEKGMESNFVKFSWNDIQSLGIEYDYSSVMHYGTHAFSKGFGATLSPIREVPQGVTIGQRRAMSESDIKKINHLYDCHKDMTTDTIITALIRLIIDIRNQL